ncbi:hypothetical protein [Spartinivicinus poritis]|uniref:Uncharacterized protein n=1 Tax=Spartinivicinus poritis TaxID=2994640 RepID=A0ABT5UAT0_9GAMM|nr:hypothetical protein [Spartinivicinus sp. A2-2]MDE1463491.1 hypothetical protein [Spartinivicinus sp. A2-2]
MRVSRIALYYSLIGFVLPVYANTQDVGWENISKTTQSLISEFGDESLSSADNINYINYARLKNRNLANKSTFSFIKRDIIENNKVYLIDTSESRLYQSNKTIKEDIKSVFGIAFDKDMFFYFKL